MSLERVRRGSEYVHKKLTVELQETVIGAGDELSVAVPNQAAVVPGGVPTDTIKGSDDAEHAVAGRLQKRFGDYDLLEEIGRGGMGVVYRARQRKLDRIVAVKMIITGDLADERAVERFQVEAESAASLDHPGIVPIHEIGQTDGCHFFSMSFVDGRSLASVVADGPLDATAAARLLIKIARAVGYAHRRGVIHRDLKASPKPKALRQQRFLIGSLIAAGAVIGLTVFAAIALLRSSPQTDPTNVGSNSEGADHVDPPPSEPNATPDAAADIEYVDLPPIPDFPRVPGAIERLPRSVVDVLPFDVLKLYDDPPLDQNAASLCLDVLADISREMVSCYPASEREKRLAATELRSKQISDVYTRWRNSPGSIGAQDLTVHQQVFDKLKKAQERPSCAFRAGLGFSALLSHVQAAREIARIAQVRATVALKNGDIDSVIEDLAVVLRLSRDLNSSGFIISYLVSVAMDRICDGTIVPDILNSPHATAAQCARIRDLLLEHSDVNPTLFRDCLKSEHLSMSNSIFGIQHRLEDFSEESIQSMLDDFGLKSEYKPTIGRMLLILGLNFFGVDANSGGISRETAAFAIDTRLAVMTADDFRHEQDTLSSCYQAADMAIANTSGGFADRKSALEQQINSLLTRARGDQKIQLTDFLASPKSFSQSMSAHTRNLTGLNGTLCLVAIKHWQLRHKEPPSGVAVLCEDAGLAV